MKENQNLKFTFDFAHAITISSEDIPLYINRFKDRLAEVHLAMLNRNLKDHWFLHKYDSPEIRNLLKHIKNIDVPVILECVASTDDEVELIKKEMEYIKEI